MPVPSILCLFDRHRPVRFKIKSDGGNYFGHCRHCGAAIERHGHRDWRRAQAVKA